MSFRASILAAALLIASPAFAAKLATPVAGTPIYRLAPDDKIRVTVFGENDLTGQYLVGSDGNISFPLIGNVRAAGLTLPEFQQALTTQLGASYLKNPKVSADIVDYRPFYILGEVNRAGQYPYRAGISVVAAVATASGFTYRANHKTVAIKHIGEDGEKKYRLTADLLVQPGDTIRVLERFF